MKKLSTRTFVRQALIAAIYFVLTVSLGNFGFGPVQFRYTEVLNMLAFYNPFNAIGVTLGVFLSNTMSTLGVYDMVFGTLHTAISLFFITKSTNLLIASFWPTIFAFIIGYELSFLAGFGAFLPMTGGVMLSEFIIMTLISVPLFKVLEKNKQFLNIIGSYEDDKYMNRKY